VNQVFEAAAELAIALVEGGFDYCFIGGLAVQRWGEPRMTKDADATVLTRFVDDEKLVDFLFPRFPSREGNTREFALRYRIIRLETVKGIALDVGLGALDFEVTSVDRSSIWQVNSDVSIRTCTAEDLVVHKAFASRNRDWLDVEGILMRQGKKLNIRQIFADLRPLTDLKEDPEIIPRLEGMMRKRGLL